MFFTGALAFIWGLFWACYLQFTRLGRFLAVQRTWITVVIGVGVDLIIARRFMSNKEWWWLVTMIAMSSIPIIGRSLFNEFGEIRDFIDDQLRRQQPLH